MRLLSGTGGLIGSTKEVSFVDGLPDTAYKKLTLVGYTFLYTYDAVGAVSTMTSMKAGDLVVVSYVAGGSVDLTAGMNMVSSGYTLLYSTYVNSSVYDTNLKIYYKILTSSETTIEVGGTGSVTRNMGAVHIYVWRNADPVTPFDATRTVATATASGNADPPAITPVTPGAVVMVVGAAGGPSSTYLSPLGTVNTLISSTLDGRGYITSGVANIGWYSGVVNPRGMTLSNSSSSCSYAAVTIAIRPESTGVTARPKKTKTSGIWNLPSIYEDKNNMPYASTEGLTPYGTYTSGGTIPDLYTEAYSRSSVILACNPIFPVTPSNGVLFEMGGSGNGTWAGLRASGTVFRVRCGDGSADLTSSSATCIVLDTTEFPRDGLIHSVIVEFRVRGAGTNTIPSRIRLWIDGILKGTSYLSNLGTIDPWAGTDPGGYQMLISSVVVGEPTTSWPGPDSGLGLRIYTNQQIR